MTKPEPCSRSTRGSMPTEYADRCDADEAHLIIFDRQPGRTWEGRI